jgi:cell wall-active antibiotic response 4TMS protein YvqF
MPHGLSESPGTPEFRLTPQLLLGIFAIAAGVLFTLDNLGILEAADYIRFWPVVLVAVGALKLSQSHKGSGAMAGFLFLFVGMWLLLEELTVFRVRLADIWPLLLVVIGGYLVWRGMSSRAEVGSGAGGSIPTGGLEPERRPSPGAHDGSSRISAVAILGAFSRGSNSKAFRGADLTAIMGGCEIDLRNAAIDGEAYVDVFALWGGIEIRVPDTWTIESRVVPILGGVDDQTRAPQSAAVHRLILRGVAIMGGVEIKN